MPTKPKGEGQTTRRRPRASRYSRPRGQDQPWKDAAPSSNAPPFIDVLKALFEPGSAVAELQALAVKQCLAPWVIFLRCYREMLDERTANLSPEDRARRFVKALMAAYLESAKSASDQNPFLAAHREVIDACLRTAEDLLRKGRPSRR